MSRRALQRMVLWLAPGHRRSWAQAMVAEIAAIEDRRAATHFALGCLVACARFQLEQEIWARRIGSGLVTDRFSILTLGCGLAGGLVGLSYLLIAGAPLTMVTVNGAAILIGLFFALGLRASVRINDQVIMGVAFAGALILLGTATFGHAVEEARRWLAIGPFFIQTSLILLPILVTGFARLQNPATATAMVLTAAAMAIQPDRAMAVMLFVAVALVGLFRPGRLTFGTAMACAIALAITLLLPDRLPAVPFVDHILWTGFAIGPWVGLLLWAGCLTLVCPILFVPGAQRTVPQHVLAGSWLTLIAAAAIGAYPTPVVGYGASAILGYFLSLLFLQPLPQGRATEAGLQDDPSNSDETSPPLRSSISSFAT
ncbi:hypothetical protein [Parasphingorhabdus sp.]|uniref:hypothetical protein n=1 Tax=Parasphingorhabdus sp. TaxID=2709688 RepID=UPI0030033A36